MPFDIPKSIAVLSRTPGVLTNLLDGLDDEWIINNEGPDTFSPYDVLGHLIHGERTDWRPRIEIILQHGLSRTFDTYDRFAQYRESQGKSPGDLLKEFETLRSENIRWLQALNLSSEDLRKKGVHPSLGEVTLQQLFSTWVVHDLTHIAQITRVMAKQYKEEIGPWTSFFRILSF